MAEPKSEPPLNFFCVVQQSSAITHLFVKLFDDTIYPLVKNTRIEEAVQKKRDQTLNNAEDRLNLGLERQLNIVQSYAKYILTVEQKKTDFKPEDECRDLSVMSNVSFKRRVSVRKRV